MPPLRLDFKRRRLPFTPAGLVVLAAGAALVTQLAWLDHELKQKLHAAEQKLTRLEKEGKRRVQAPGQTAEGAALQLEVRQANEILRQLALPWHGLFKAIESSNEKEIALLAVQPDMQKRVLRLSGEAKNFEALLAYVARLEKNEALSQVYITQHEIRSQDPERPVRFALVANWVDPR
jgi:Tfp pilus assembly protein PilN